GRDGDPARLKEVLDEDAALLIAYILKRPIGRRGIQRREGRTAKDISRTDAAGDGEIAVHREIAGSADRPGSRDQPGILRRVLIQVERCAAERYGRIAQYSLTRAAVGYGHAVVDTLRLRVLRIRN